MKAIPPRKRQFYVYALLDTRKPGIFKYGKWVFHFEPFYIGKGKGDRAESHFKFPGRSKNEEKNKVVVSIHRKGLELKYVIKKASLTEQEAFQKERELIARIGRLDFGKGPLTNRSSGGEGDAGRSPPSRTTHELRAVRRAQELPAAKEARQLRQSLAQKVRYALRTEAAKKRTAQKLKEIQLTRDEAHKLEIRAKRSLAIKESWLRISEDERRFRVERMRVGRGYSNTEA